MATPSHSQAVKSLNKSSGRRRFVFKTFSQRVHDIDIDVYRSLDKVKSEPSEGSSYFRDCLIEWRELNTAEDFIFCYEEILPLAQTLPLVILHKESIFSLLLSRVQIKARLSLEPILRLIAALSRDLLEDFLPFLPRITDALVSLLDGGASREPEIIEQVFTSWSHIMMYLQKYFTRNLLHLLKVTVTLRYYAKDYIQEFMAEATSFLLRNAPVDQLNNGIKQIILEAVKKPLATRIYGASALLFHTMRGTSSRFHSRAELVVRFLISCPTFGISREFSQGSDTFLEVVNSAFHRLCEEMNPEELNMLWKCLFEEITNAVMNNDAVHLTGLLMLLTSAVQYATWKTISDYKPMLELVDLLVGKFVNPLSYIIEDDLSEVISMILQLMLVILDGLHSSGDSSTISSCSLHWAPIFRLKSTSLLTFVREVLQKDASVLCAFKTNVLRIMNEWIESSPEEVIYLLLSFCERLPIEVQCTFDEEVPRICSFFIKVLGDWIKVITDIVQGSSLHTDVNECELAIFWGVIRCYPYIFKLKAKSSLLVDLIDALDRLSTIEGNAFGVPKKTWDSLIGATLGSYLILLPTEKSGLEESRKLLYLATKYNSCTQVLLAVADFLDFIYGPALEVDISRKIYPEDLHVEKFEEAVQVFADNLHHSNKEIRISTLRILCHYEPLRCDIITKDPSIDNEMETENSHACDNDCVGSEVLRLFLSIETTPISISTSRKIILLISKVQMALLAGRIPEVYLPLVLNGVIGIFRNRFSYIWDQASECLASLISRYTRFVWDKLFHYFQRWLFLLVQPDREIAESSAKLNDLLRCFQSFVFPVLDCTPLFTVLSLVLQSLQKIPTAVESQSRHILPMFLTFLGYDSDHVAGVNLFKAHNCKSKEWKCVLKEWLNLLRRTHNLKAFYKSEFLKEVLERRLLDDNDAEIQSTVLDCLLIWKDDSLTLYDQHLKNLISPKTLREELTRWSLSKESNQIDEQHRPYLVPLVIRLLMPKVRKLKILGSRKQASVNLRKAVLVFIAQLDESELSLFFALILKPLNVIPTEPDATANWFWNSHISSFNKFSVIDFLKYFSNESVTALSWKKKFGFLHVVEEVLAVFDEMRVRPFLDILLGCVVRVLGSCISSLHAVRKHDMSLIENDDKSNKSSLESDKEAATSGLTSTAVKQYKELRSLCLRVISVVLNKYDDYDFGSEFWDLFFMSVKSSIESFKHEGASSEKPSSLFSCFVSMSRSQQLVSMLAREKNLVPDIFSILMVPSASQSIKSFVLKFIENLLTFNCESDGRDSALNSVLLPNLDALILNLHGLFLSDGTSMRKLVNNPEESMIRILKLVSKLIRDRWHAKMFVQILLPYLTHSVRISDLHVDTVQVIRNVVPILGSECTTEILKAVSPLLTSVELDMRLLICDLIDGLAEVDSSILHMAQMIRGLNATSTMEIGGLDFDTIVNTYEKINVDFFRALPVEHALIILSQCVYDMASEELILRHSAYRSSLAFVEFSSSILGQEEMVLETSSDNTYWSKVCILRIINKFILKHMGEAMNRATSVKKEWINLLREMVLKFPDVANFSSLKTLYSKDAEVDFFSNITHLQKLRRARALSRFKNTIITVDMPEVITKNVFVPLFFNMLFDLQKGKSENIRIACIEALASISGRMEWKSYLALLKRCFREITENTDKRKVLLRLICSILDKFHFLDNFSSDGLTDSGYPAKSLTYGAPVVTSEIQECLIKVVLPKIQKLLNYQSEKLDVYVNLAALKVLKLLPEDVMDSQLLSIIQHIVNFLKNRLESIRDEARSALAACLKELGLEYLQVIVKVLRGTLKRGYELHVLGYTLNFILSKFLVDPVCGKMDYCLEDLLSVVEKDILGEVAEEKEVEKVASKMKETRKQKSFETLKLIAQCIIFKSHALKLLKPVADHMKNHLTPKVKAKLENMLTNIAAGFESNPSIDQCDLLIFIYGLVDDGIKVENEQGESSAIVEAIKHARDVKGRNFACGTILAKSPGSHLIMVFALKLLNGYMKKVQLACGDAQLLSMLDPFVALLGNCLTSKYEDVLSISLRCLTPLLRLPLPSVKSQADKIKGVVLNIAQSSTDPHNPLIESCLRLLTVLLRNEKVTLSTHQLHLLIQFPLFVDIEKNPSFVALSLLKAIISCKLVVPEIYDLATRVAELMVTSQVESIRKKCSKILLQFLLDYRLSEKRLQQHLDFLLSNLRYEHSTGREAVLEMLYAIIVKFPRSVVDGLSQTLFVHLVVCLANDQDNNVRSMTGAVIKRLLGCISSGPLHSILDYSLSWYLGGKQQLWSAAAQVLGLLVESLKGGFERHIKTVLPVAKGILHSVVDYTMNEQLDFSPESSITFWKEAYYSLVMLEKMLRQFHELFFEKYFEDIWEMICHLLLHPHMWIRSVSNRLLALYFTTEIENSRLNSEKSIGAYFLTRPSRLFLIAVSLCCQLKAQLTDNDADVILQNIVFAICGLNSVIGRVENANSCLFWSTLEQAEQKHFLEALQLLDSGKGRSKLLPRITGVFDQNDGCAREVRLLLVSNLLKQIGKTALQTDIIQMKIVFNAFSEISSQMGVEDFQQYAYEILLPLHRVREGFAGKLIPDSMTQLAQEVCDRIQNRVGIQKFVQVYSQIQKNLKAKRDKRKQEEKRMAVINPMRNAKRKLRVAAKQRASKRRKIMSMKMSRRML